MLGCFVLPSYYSQASYHVNRVSVQRILTVSLVFATMDFAFVTRIGGAICASFVEKGEVLRRFCFE